MMWLTMAFKHWYWIVIGSLAIALSVSMGYGRMVAAERDAKTAEMESMQNASKQYKDQSEFNAKVINDAIPFMVEQAKKNAYANYLKKFGSNPACGVRAEWLRAKDGVGEAISTERTDDPTSEFVAACATDAGRLKLWQDWAVVNQLPMK